MRRFVYLAKALADTNRLRLLAALRGRELCVCQLVELMGLAQSTVSKHLSILYQAELVDARKAGRWMLYRLAEAGAPVAARTALDWVRESLEDDPVIRRDAQRLEEIARIDRETLCRRSAPG